MQSPSNEKIISDYNLWQEYVDPNGLTTKEQFDKMTDEQKRQILAECFGSEKPNQE